MIYRSIAHFLEHHSAVLCDVLDQAATEAGGHYALMSAADRRRNAEHDAAEMIRELAQGHIDRQAVRASGARPTATGLVADDLLRLIEAVESRLEALVNRELADQPDLRDELLRQYRLVHARFRADLTSVKIDHVLNQFRTPPRSS